LLSERPIIGRKKRKNARHRWSLRRSVKRSLPDSNRIKRGKIH